MMKTYERYKPSGVEWLGDIPEHWNVKRLKFVANVQSSNVDKKSFDDEVSVSLCNYVDVYKNEFIRDGIPFMKATATENEIEKFILDKGDVLITKDSETPDDIANPALVMKDFENVICGYHLAQIKPDKADLCGEYLFRLFQSKRFNSYFEVSANGITRFGLSLDSITGVFVSLPPLPEQAAIAKYLDEKTAQLDKLIKGKRRLIALLKEERSGVINNAVTRGINPHAKLKPSGIDWLGEIPEYWRLIKLKFLVNYIKGYAFKTDYFQPEGVPVIKASDIKNLTVRQGKDFLNPDVAEQFDRVKLKRGDIIVSTVGSTPDVINSAVGQIAKVPDKFDGAYLNQNTVRIYSNDEEILSNDFLLSVLLSNPYRKYIDLHAHGTANQASINIEDMLNFTIAFPIVPEQKQIVQFIEAETGKIDATVAKIEKEIEYLREYRTALISEVITGKIKVA